MECRRGKTVIILISFAFMFIAVGCGYLENDQTEYQKDIVGNIKIQKQQNSISNNLVFAETNEIYAIITEDCKNVYYDSVNNRIYADSYINETNRNYYQINIINSLGKSVSNAIKKEKISESDFISKTKEIKTKWEFLN